MPSATTIALYDGQGTPVSHDFEPVSVTPANSLLVNRDADTSAGQMQLIVGLSPANGSRKTNRVNLRFNMPIEHTVDGVVRVAYTARAICEFVLPEEMTQANRDDFAAYIKNATADAVISGVISDLDPLY
jgi:hypothetical protein